MGRHEHKCRRDRGFAARSAKIRIYLSARQQGRQAMAARSTAMMAAAGSRVALAPALRAVPRGALAQNTAVTQVRERRD